VLTLLPDFHFSGRCPHCGGSLAVKRWLVPGMRSLAEASCGKCGGDFYTDLPTGQACLTPVMLDAKSGETFSPAGASWFARWLSDGFANRRNTPPPIKEEVFRPLRRPVLLNCLDTLYGHELMKLMNAQHYLDYHPDKDLVVLIHANFRWLVPDGVAAVWSLDEPLSKGAGWNEGLADFVHVRLASSSEAWLARAINLPHADDFDIVRFTRVRPFPRKDFTAWLEAIRAPQIVFVCRDDRTWFGSGAVANFLGRAARVLTRRGLPLNWLVRSLQHRAIVAFGNTLRRSFPALTLTIIGVGQQGGLPAWIQDRRVTRPSPEEEVETCRLCAQAHMVIGVHGSNMLLPTAHAGAVIDLMPRDRWGNLAQDITLPMGEARDQALRVLFLPVSTAPNLLAHIAGSTLEYAHYVLRLGRNYTRHDAAMLDGLADFAAQVHKLTDGR